MGRGRRRSNPGGKSSKILEKEARSGSLLDGGSGDREIQISQREPESKSTGINRNHLLLEVRDWEACGIPATFLI